MKKGFTLVELSIVLVIIGLLIGGILVGQSLIEASKISKIVRDVYQIQVALRTFKAKYKFFPGDYPKGAQLGCPSGSCTGNGNNLIDWNEMLNSWYQLGVTQTYTGTFSGGSPATNPYIAGKDIPAVKEIGDNAGYMLSWWSSGDPSLKYGKNYIVIAKNTINGPALSVERTIAIDSKIDDGKRGSGTVSGLGNAYVCDQGGNYYNWGAGAANITNPNACVVWMQFDDN